MASLTVGRLAGLSRTTPAKDAPSTVTVLAPLKDSAAAVSARLRALESGGSPFAASDRTHFARLLVMPARPRPQERPDGMRRAARVLDFVTHLGRPQRPDDLSASYLLFSAAYDRLGGDDREYFEHLRYVLGDAADDIWQCCRDYPGSQASAAFVDFLAERQVQARYVFTPPRTGTVMEIKEALRLRQQVLQVAVATQDADDAALRRRFRDVFRGQDDAESGDPSRPGDERGPDGTFGSQFSSEFDPTFDAMFDLDDDAEPSGEAFAPEAPADEDQRWSGDDGGPVPVDPDRRLRRLDAPDLADVQGVVVGYPTHHAAAYLFLKITDAERARQWLSGVEVTTGAQAGELIRLLKSAPAGDAPAEVSQAALHIAFSYSGLARLGVPDADLSAFDDPFRAGMAAREAALTPGRGTSPWRSPFRPDRGGRSPVHVMVHVSAPTREVLSQTIERLDGELEGSGFHVVTRQEGHRIVDPRQPESERAAGKRARYVEHFGFADGLSQPFIAGVSRRNDRRSSDPLPTGEVLLGYPDIDDDLSGTGTAEALARNGTYLVYRKLEQDVDAFHGMARQVAARFASGSAGTDGAAAPAGADVAAAKLVGRRQDGAPLVVGGDNTDPLAEFGFQSLDPEGFGCPVGSHVRRVNPRDSRPLETGPPNKDKEDKDPIEPRLVRRHRMVRRGIPYGTYRRDGASQVVADLPPGLPPDLLSDGFAPVATGPDVDRGAGAEERGLLFVALVADIARQFEFVQAHWMADGNAFRLGSDQDVFSGGGGAGMKITIPGERPTFVPFERPVVNCRGGEYFFLPGVRALQEIVAAAAR